MIELNINCMYVCMHIHVNTVKLTGKLKLGSEYMQNKLMLFLHSTYIGTYWAKDS